MSLKIVALGELNIEILFPFAIGAAGGLIAFAHFLSWGYKKFRDGTLPALTGFVLGYLMILWPWKTTVPRLDAQGYAIIKERPLHNFPPVFLNCNRKDPHSG